MFFSLGFRTFASSGAIIHTMIFAEATNLICEGVTLTLPDGSNARSTSWSPRFAPMRLCSRKRVCAVFVSDPESADETDEEALRQLYDSSRAEARVAAPLMQARSAEQISEELYVSLSTAWTHMRRIFDKTSTRRQGELVSLLLRSPAHLRFEGADRAIDSPKHRPKKTS